MRQTALILLAVILIGFKSELVNLYQSLINPIVVVEQNFDENNLRLVRNSNGFGFQNIYGEVVIPCRYKSAESFSCGIANVSIENNSNENSENGDYYFVINTKGNKVYDKAELVKEEHRAVCVNEKWGFVDNKGILTVPLKYATVSNFSDGLSCVAFEKEHCGIPYNFINCYDSVIIANVAFGEFKHGVAMLDPTENDCYYYINKKGNNIFNDDIGFNKCSEFCSDFAIVEHPVNDKYYVINNKGEFIYENYQLKNYIDNPCSAFEDNGIISFEKLNKINKFLQTPQILHSHCY